MTVWGLLAASIVCSVSGTLSLRASEGLRKRGWIVPIGLCYAAGFGLLVVVLSRGVPLGVAYGVWASVGVALTAVGAKVFFDERLTARMVGGIALIAAGVGLIHLGLGA